MELFQDFFVELEVLPQDVVELLPLWPLRESSVELPLLLRLFLLCELPPLLELSVVLLHHFLFIFNSLPGLEECAEASRSSESEIKAWGRSANATPIWSTTTTARNCEQEMFIALLLHAMPVDLRATTRNLRKIIVE